MTNISINDTIRITDPKPGSPLRVIGVWRGNTKTPLHGFTTALVASTEKMLRVAHDIRGNRNFGTIEVGERLREATGPTLKALNEAAKNLETQKAALRNAVMNASTTKKYEQCGHWQAGIDGRMLDYYNGLPASKQALVRHQLVTSPLMHWDLCDSLLRMPAELSGLDHRERAQIRIGLFKALEPAAYEAISEQIEQLEFCERALALAVRATVDSSGSSEDLITHAPDAFEFTSSVSEPIAWLPAVEARKLLPAVHSDAQIIETTE